MGVKRFGPVGIIDIGSNSVRFVAYGGIAARSLGPVQRKSHGGARARAWRATAGSTTRRLS